MRENIQSNFIYELLPIPIDYINISEEPTLIIDLLHQHDGHLSNKI